MAYKHKEDVQAALLLAKQSGEARSLDYDGSFVELEEVYSKAEKYDEYKRKAEAWDDMRRRIDYRQSDRAFDVGVVAMNVMDEHDALMAEPEDGSDDMEPEEWGKPTNIVPVEEGRLRELEKKEAKFDKIMNARRDAMASAGQLWLSHSTFANEANRIIKEYEKGE